MKKGFTLIELVVTISVAGIFSTFAMNYYLQAIKAKQAMVEKHDEYFEYNVVKSKLKRALLDYEGECKRGKYTFKADQSCFEQPTVPAAGLDCKVLDHSRVLVYYLGKLDSSSKKLVGFSTVLAK
jgi:prepilin-type N-terminal cleavage/methylation domain-containing protein